MPIKPAEVLRGSYIKVSRDAVFAFLYPWDKSRSFSFADFVLCIWKCCWSRSKPEEVRGVLFCARVFWSLGLLIQQNQPVLASFFSCKDPLGINLAIPAPEKGSSLLITWLYSALKLTWKLPVCALTKGTGLCLFNNTVVSCWTTVISMYLLILIYNAISFLNCH